MYTFHLIKRELEEIRSQLDEIKAGIIRPLKIAVDVKEAAIMIGVSKSTLYLLMERKEIKYSSVGGKKVIKITEVERLINGREISTRRR